MIQKLLQLVLMTYFAGISLLGSSGLHALLGMSHGHLHGVVSVAHEDSHQHRCKHHHHHRAPDESQSRHHHHDDSQPEHDCPICDWAAQQVADIPPPAVELTFERPIWRPLALVVVAPCAALVIPPARGPPVVG